MKRILAVAVIFTSGLVLGLYLRGGSPTALAAAGAGGGGGAQCASQNGDVNASGSVDLSDAVTILNFLFLGNPTKLVPLCTTPAAPGGLPDTGLTSIFGGCQGQDGDYATGCPSDGRFYDHSFVDINDRTVTDNCTGLQWQKDTADLNGNGQTPTT